MGKSIVVITDFKREPWNKFIAGIKSQKITTLYITKNGPVETQIPGKNINDENIALKFQIAGNNNAVVLVRQQNDKSENKNIISHIITEWLKESDQIAICAHGNGGTLTNPKEDFAQVEIYEIFHHCDQICKKLKVLFDNITNGDSFDEFWVFIAPKPAEVANLLRYKILCPLVALGLIMQAEENNKDTKIDKKLKDQVKKAISDLTKNAQVKKNPIAALCDKYIKCDELKEKLNGLVNDTQREECSDYHSDLKYVVKKMEEQIANIAA